jgi:hypothetical protein
MKASISKKDGFDVLTIEIPINKRPSKSGMTTVIASSNGNIPTALVVDGKPVVIGVNAYIK